MSEIDNNCSSAVRRLVVVKVRRMEQRLWCNGYNSVAVSSETYAGNSVPLVFVWMALSQLASFRSRGAHESAQCKESHPGPTLDKVGSNVGGKEHMASIMLGRIMASLSTARSSETNMVMADGYNNGAGSKDDGIDIGIFFEGVRCQ